MQSAYKTFKRVLFTLSVQIKRLLKISLSRVQHMSRQHLNVLKSFKLNHTRIKGFKATQNLLTIDKYAKVFTRFFYFLFKTTSITKRELTFIFAIKLASTKNERRSLKKLFRLSDRS